MKAIKSLQRLTGHSHLQLTHRGNAAIEAALKLLPAGSSILIPEEGGWLTYHSLPPKAGLSYDEVRCHDALIDLKDLGQKLARRKYAAFLYHSLGGYSVEEPIKDIYSVCHENNCLAIMDVAGSIGTPLCDGRYADILVGSFGKWKPINLGRGGFISCYEKEIFNRIKDLSPSPYPEKLPLLLKKIQELPQRLQFLKERRQKIIKDLSPFQILHASGAGLVVIIPFSSEDERQKIVAYCQQEHLEWTKCPRYIRVNRKAICIEVKRLETKTI